MKRAFAATCLLFLGVTGCSHSTDLARPGTQDNFGVQMAKMSLWREALFRFQRAVELNPSDAMAHNNLAVAWEANGEFEKARKEYLEALKLDKSNLYIQKNYSRYVEFLSKNKKRQSKPGPSTAKPAAATVSSSTPPGTTPAGTPGISQPAMPTADQPSPGRPEPTTMPPATPPGGAF
ncbi:MAG TPA: tetratricopeptide repeat protein [Thermoanaerobaculia bacterium]|nr:tetratricopeptide repeat protein [Thermoanaerobaculia bacterium]